MKRVRKYEEGHVMRCPFERLIFSKNQMSCGLLLTVYKSPDATIRSVYCQHAPASSSNCVCGLIVQNRYVFLYCRHNIHHENMPI